MALDPCISCLGSEQCWVCLGTGFAAPERRTGRCARCQGTGSCSMCQPVAQLPPAPVVPPAPSRPPEARRVLVIDNETDLLDLLRLWLDDDPRCSHVDIAMTGDEALVLLAEHCPDTIVCDFDLGRATSDEYLPGYRSACPQARIVIHTADPERAYAAGVLERGASLVLDKGRLRLPELVDVVLGGV